MSALVEERKMTRLVKLTIFASALALAGLSASPFAAADKVHRQCIDCIPGGGGAPDVGDDQNQGDSGRRHRQIESPDDQNGPDQGSTTRRWHKYQSDDQPGADNNGPDQGMPNRHTRKYHPDDQFQQGGGEDVTIDKKRMRHADRKWEFDPNRHERRHHKDNRFRLFFGGFWYPEPYWDEPYYYDDYNDRVSCREGADIVAERFDRVRILDCGGRIYTYLGRRYGETFEIELSSRTGRILDAHGI
jgi:hypothetical protein